MIKKVYNIIGFDCANCAAKTESHLNRNSNISYARIDFAGNRLYITFKDKELSIEEILKIIKEVEPDKIEITEGTAKLNNKSFFDKKTIVLIIRIIITTILMLVTNYAVKEPAWLRITLFAIAILLIGYDIFYKVIYKIIHLRNPIDEYLLITLAVAGVIVLSAVYHEDEYFEATMVMLLFQVGQVVEHYASNKSRNAISTAIDMRSDTAIKLVDGIATVVKPEELEIGDIIVIKTGDHIPVDGVVVSGTGELDVSSLTGEFIPKPLSKDVEALSGCILKSGAVQLRVTKKYEDSTVNKILELVQSSGERKSKTTNFITKFAKWYTPGVLIVASIYLVIFGLTSGNWNDAIYRALALIVIACPCAIVISVPLAYFAGIGLASKNGIIIKGASYLDDLCKLKKLVSDKTGTLTHGSFVITKINPIGIGKDEFLDYLKAAECLSNHPIAKAIMHGTKVKSYASKQVDYVEIPGHGIDTTYLGKHIAAGTYKFLKEYGLEFEETNEIGTVVYLAVDEKYVGYVILSDEIKEDAQPMVDLLHSKGVEIVLLTGDKENIARNTCETLGIDRWHSELLPEDKTKYLQMEMDTTKGKVAFIGDGINDAPSIILSDIGIAMGGVGSDMAVANSDVVIMNDDPAKVYDAMKIAKVTRSRAFFCIIFSLLVKIVVMILDGFGYAPMWLAVLADTGLTCLMIVAALLVLYHPIKRPNLYNK